MTTTAVLDTTLVSAAPRKLSAMVRTQAEAIETRLDDAREQVRQALTKAVDALFHALAIPTSRDLHDLSERLARIEVEVSRLTGKKLIAPQPLKKKKNGAPTRAKK